MEIIYRIRDWFRGAYFGARNSRWSSVRKIHLSIHPLCAVCGVRGTLLKPNEVHHIVPFSVDKSLELDLQNLITLCKPHHLLIGHLMSFMSFNKDVREDALLLNNKIKQRP